MTVIGKELNNARIIFKNLSPVYQYVFNGY